MEFKASEISLKDFLLLQPKQKGEFLIDQAFSFDHSSLHTNDTSEDTWSLSSLSPKKAPKLKNHLLVDPNQITLKEMVVKRQRCQAGSNKKNEGNHEVLLSTSKRIKKDDDEKVTSASFAKRQHTQKWNIEETKKFYKVN